MGLERIEKSLKFCWLCGSCFGRGPTEPHNWREINPDPSPNERCPSYEYFKFRTYTAMDRNSLSTLIYREGYPITDELKEVIYSCVMCGVCTEICGLVDPVDINLAAREEVVEKSTLLPTHERLLATHIKSGNPYSRGSANRGKWAEGLQIKDLTKDRAENLFFVGCTTALRPAMRKVAVKSAKLFQKAGVDFGILGAEEKCCGYIPRTLGDRSSFEKAAAENIEVLNGLNIKRLITCCPGCLLTFKSYPKGSLNFEVMHSVQFIEQLIIEGKIQPGRADGTKVTYHDPCDLGRACRIFEPPRKILNAIQGSEFIEMERHGRWSYCCGSGGCVEHILPEMVDFNSESRIREAEATGAGVLITACPQCHMTLLKASRRIGSEIEVEDVSVFLFDTMD